MNELPFSVGGHGVFVTFAQEAQVVRVFQLLQRQRVGSVLVVEAFDGNRVLFSAKDQLIFFFTFDLLANPRRFDRQHDHHDGNEEHDGEEQVSFFAGPRAVRARFEI